MQCLVIAAYRCHVAGRPTDSIDIQVIYIEGDSPAHAANRVRESPTHSYANASGATVEWILTKILASDEFNDPNSGDEIVGLITTAEELSTCGDL